MSNKLYAKLESEASVATWPMLSPHHRREALFLVDDSLDLIEVGVAVAEDNASSLNRWLEEGLVSRPTDEEVSAWDASENQKHRFHFVILQPFVFAQVAPPETTLKA